jgi:hypothetical protein
MKRQTLALVGLLIIASLFPISKKVEVEVEVKVNRPIVVQTKASMEQKRANKLMADNFARVGFGWDKNQRACVHLIFTKESRYDHLAKNQQGSSAFGIGQVLGEKSKDPATQILRAFHYMEHRHNTPCNAWKHHRNKGWY